VYSLPGALSIHRVRVFIGLFSFRTRPDFSVESGLGLLLPYCRIEKGNHLDVRVKSSSQASFAWRSAFFDMENVYFQDDAGVSPRKVNCWQKVWGGLIPTYESTLKLNCSYDCP
jgi:hypothetical protein